MPCKITKRFNLVLEAILEKKSPNSVNQIALQSGIHSQSLYDIKKGKKRPTLSMIEKLAKTYQIDTRYIF